MAEDRRVRRTRAALQEALLSLMAEKGYDKITVQDLIDRADVGRSTFYLHFTDKSDLLQDALSQLGLMLGTQDGSGSPTARPGPPAASRHSPTTRPDRRRPVRFSLPMLQHVQEQQATARALLAPSGTDAVRSGMERMLTGVVTEELQALAAVSAPPRVPLDLVAAGVVATFMAVLGWWIADDFARPAQEVDAAFLTLVAPGIRAAIPPPPVQD